MSANDPSHEAPAETTARFTPEVLADATAAPHVVPVGWSYNPELGTIDISGHNFAATRKYRNVQANQHVAFVVDDVLPPFRPRCVMVQGTAQSLDANRSGGTEAMTASSPRKLPHGPEGHASVVASPPLP